MTKQQGLFPPGCVKQPNISFLRCSLLPDEDNVQGTILKARDEAPSNNESASQCLTLELYSPQTREK